MNLFSSSLIILFLVAVIGISVASAASTTATYPAQQRIKTLPTSPVSQTPAVPTMRQTSDDNSFQSPVSDISKISNTFQPRWKISLDRYDMHRGIDFYGETGDTISCIGTGIVHSVDNSTGGGGGRTVYIEHELPASLASTKFHTRDITRVFSVYNHLDTIDPSVSTVGANVTKGQSIGTMGSTGDTEFVHLHFETRLETYCSLQYQVANDKVASPTSKCNGGFDPHVHPFLFIPGANSGEKSIEEIEPLNASYSYAIRYNATRGHLDFDRLVTNKGTVIGCNLREGMNASTIEQLDDLPNVNEYLTLLPGVFQSTTEDEIYFDFHFRADTHGKPTSIEIYDIYGNGIKVENSALLLDDSSSAMKISLWMVLVCIAAVMITI